MNMTATSDLTSLPDVEKAIDDKVKELEESFAGVPCFPLLIGDRSIDTGLVDEVFDDLRSRFGQHAEHDNLIVLLESSGGDINAAYNLSQLLRRYGKKRLEIVIPRRAKSAATLLACSGDVIKMTPVSELGPVDPQITQVNALEGRLENFSPLNIESTLELIRNEYAVGNKEMADGLLQRLQFPLTLGSFKKTLDLSKQYLGEILSTRMLCGQTKEAQEAARLLTEGYSDHGYCINLAECRKIGLEAVEIEEPHLSMIWEIHRISSRRRELTREMQIKDKLDDLPPSLRDVLRPELRG